LILKAKSGGTRNFHLGRAIPRGSGGRKSPIGVQGRSPGRSWNSLQTMHTDFDCNWTFRTNHLHDTWSVCFTMRAKWHFGGL